LLRTSFSGNPTFREVLGRVREAALGAFANQDLPFEQLVEELQPERDLSYNPLTQIMFVLLNAPADPLELSGLEVSPVDIESAASFCVIAAHRWERGGRLSGWLDYSTALFEPATIDRLLGHFRVVLEAIVRRADLPVLKLPLLTERERRLILHDWNDTAREF